MKNLLKCSSLIRVTVIIVVMAFMASQMTDTYAKENQGTPGIIANLEQHDDNMNVDHGILSGEHSDLDTKLDQVLEGGGGDCPTCCDAWDKVIPVANDRFELVMGGAALRDNETCLVWEQAPNDQQNVDWVTAVNECYIKEVGGRFGWRLPTAAELASLIDTSQTNPALPPGHPFEPNAVISVALPIWTSTTNLLTPEWAYSVDINSGVIDFRTDKEVETVIWCVRGGQGNDSWR